MATQQKKATQPRAGKEMAMRFCSNPPVIVKGLDAGIANERARLILINRNKWANGTTLHYYFFNKAADGAFVDYEDGTREWISWRGSKAQQEVVRKAFTVWKKTGIGLVFKEVKHREDAEIRIGFMKEDGSWSYVGRDILLQPVEERTMNFGWNIAITDRHNGIDTAIHEIGHTLGLQHEHQNPFAGIVWDEDAVYASLGAPPNNWDKATTYENIIKKLDKRMVNGSNWDPASIMHYPFEAGLIKKPTQFIQGLQPPGGVSEQDITYALKFYPTVNPTKDMVIKSGVPVAIAVDNAEQQDFIFKPTATRYYTLATTGIPDTVMVLSHKKEDGQLQFISGDDNSGTGENALIKIKLFRGNTYLIQLKVYYKKAGSKTILLIS